MFAVPLVTCTWFGWGMMSTAMSVVGYTANAAFYLAIVLLAALDRKTVRLLNARWLRWLGSIAYGLYLVHGFALDLAFDLAGISTPAINGWRDVALTAGALCASLAVAWASWVWFERPLIAWGGRFTGRASNTVTTPAQVAVDAAGST